MNYANSMKVTVNFGTVRVIVPCGNGEIAVRDVLELAVTRYKKATNKPHDAWVTVHNVKSYKDDAILDQDDLIADVCDDRENLIALYAEHTTSPLSSQHHTGDGTSASSVGTESPDLYIEGSAECREKLTLGMSSLHVRRGSEPALVNDAMASLDNQGKRWSAAVVPDEQQTFNNTTDPNNNSNNIGQQQRRANSFRETGGHNEESDEEDLVSLRPANFNRNANRRSMLASAYEWYEAADRTLGNMGDGGEIQQGVTERSDPVGGYGYPASHERHVSGASDPGRETVVVLPNEDGPLGIHVVPEQGYNGSELGLVVQGIEPGGRVDRDGRLRVGDRITEVNGRSLMHLSFTEAQLVFRSTLNDPQIVIRVSGKSMSLPTSPVAKVPPCLPPPPIPREDPPTSDDAQNNNLFHAVPSSQAQLISDLSPKVAAVSPTKKDLPVGVTPAKVASLNAANTRKIGKKVIIDLIKGDEGLGFSITTRDNLAGGLAPIYIKSILPRGSAIQDGRLRSGDRLLEVNSIEVTGKTQPEVVSILRNIPVGKAVHLLVSRQECLDPAQNLPREIPPDKCDAPPDEVGIYPWKERHIMTLDIPSNDTGSAGLGISVKGKTSTNGNGPAQDLGLFIKSVINGGAASKDGRLKPNDQLLSINGQSLLGKTNSEAMDTLRHAMFKLESAYIQLTIARRLPSADSEENLKFEEGFLSTSSGSSSIMDSKENVNQTVTYNSPFGNGRATPTAQMDKDTFNKSLRNESVYGSINKRNPVIDKLLGSPGALDVSSVLDGGPGTPLHSNVNGNTSGGNLQQMIYGRTNIRPAPFNGSPTGHDLNVVNHSSTPMIEKNGVLINEDYPVTNNQNNEVEPPTPDVLNTSEMSLIDGAQFSRDGFGRQSMSEKRHAHLDAKSTDTYKRNKEQRMMRQHQGGSGRLQQSKSGSDIRQRSGSQPASFKEQVLYRSNSCDSINTTNPSGLNGSIHPSQPHPVHPQTTRIIENQKPKSNKENKQPSPEFDYRPLPLVPKTPNLFPVQMFYPACCTLANGESPGTESSTTSYEGVRPSLRCLPLSMQRSNSLESITQKRGCNPSFRAAVDKSYPKGWSTSRAYPTTSASVSPPTKSFKRVQRVDEEVSGEGGVHTPLRGAIPLDSFSPLSPDEKPRKKGFFRGMFRFGKNRKTIPEPGGNKHSLEAERRRMFLEEQKSKKTIPQATDRTAWERAPVAATRGQSSSRIVASNVADYGSSPNQNGLPLVSNPQRPDRVSVRAPQYHPEKMVRQMPREQLEEWYERRMHLQHPHQQMDLYGTSANGRPLPPIPNYGQMTQFQAQPSSQFRPEDLGHFSRSISLRSNRSAHSHLDYGIVTRGMKQYTVYREIERPGSRVGLVDPTSPNGGQYSHYANFNQIQMHMRQSSEPAHHLKPRPVSNYGEVKGRTSSHSHVLPPGVVPSSSNPAHVYATMSRPTVAPRTSMSKTPSGSKV